MIALHVAEPTAAVRWWLRGDGRLYIAHPGGWRPVTLRDMAARGERHLQICAGDDVEPCEGNMILVDFLLRADRVVSCFQSETDLVGARVGGLGTIPTGDVHPRYVLREPSANGFSFIVECSRDRADAWLALFVSLALKSRQTFTVLHARDLPLLNELLTYVPPTIGSA